MKHLIRKTVWLSFALGMAFYPAKAVQWPEETDAFGVAATHPQMAAYADHVVKEYPLSIVAEDERSTLNNMGTTMKNVGPFSLKFLEFAAQSSLPVLSVGEGTGNITQLALEKNITFIANDMDPRHLGHIYASTPQEKQGYLFLKAGKFPDEVNLPKESLGAIYFGRVLHFQTGEEIEKSLQAAFNILKPGGKVFGRASAPFQKNLIPFLATYEKRKEDGVLWPGICTDMQQGWPTLHPYLPSFMHLLDVDVLSRTLKEIGFEIEDCSYTPIDHPDFKLDGREGVGFIAIKR